MPVLFLIFKFNMLSDNLQDMSFCLRKGMIVLIAAFILTGIPCYPADSFSKEEQEEAALSYVRNMSPEDAASQLFLVNIEGSTVFNAVESYADIYPELESEKEKLSARVLVPGGCLFFSYNIGESAVQVMHYIESIKKVYDDSGLPFPIIAVDQEGGVVNRLRSVTSPLPSSQKTASVLSPSEAERLYFFQAEQMKALGFTMNLSPVAEPLVEENRDFLLTRSFGSPAKTVAYCIAQINAFETSGICTVVKHFPGNTNTDPHTGLPKITVPESEFYRVYLKPFEFILTVSPGAVLMSHARVAFSEVNEPAALSSYWINEKLKNEYLYDGLVISDDIFMAALSRNGFPPETAAVKAVEAGTDIIMLSEKRFASALRVLLDKAASDESFRNRLEKSEQRVILSKIHYGILECYRNEDGKVCVRNKKDEMPERKRLDVFLESYESGMNFYRKNF